MEETVTERKYNRLEWFFYIILLPVSFTLALTGILMTLLGYDVITPALEWGNKIPYVEKVLPDAKTDQKVHSAQQPSAEMQIAELNQQIAALNEEIQQKQSEVEAAKKEKEAIIENENKLKQEIVDMQKQMEEKRITDQERKNKINDLAKLYTTMSASKAAPIIGNLSMEEAVLVLAAMKPAERAAIVSKMNPKQAADLTILLKDTELSENDEIAALQQRIQALTGALAEVEKTKRDIDEMVSSFSVMKPEAAADIIINMLQASTGEKEKALAILGKMPNQQRGTIMEKLNDKTPELTAKITSLLIE